MSGTDGPDPDGIDRGEEAESNYPGSDGQEVPKKLEHAAGPVQVVLLRVGVSGEVKNSLTYVINLSCFEISIGIRYLHLKEYDHSGYFIL